MFSTHHPFNPSVLEQGKYFETELVEDVWGSFGTPKVKVQFFNRPLSEMILPLRPAGFLVEQMIEPRPTEACREQYPAFYERLLTTSLVSLCSSKKNEGVRIYGQSRAKQDVPGFRPPWIRTPPGRSAKWAHIGDSFIT